MDAFGKKKTPLRERKKNPDTQCIMVYVDLHFTIEMDQMYENIRNTLSVWEPFFPPKKPSQKRRLHFLLLPLEAMALREHGDEMKAQVTESFAADKLKDAEAKARSKFEC